MERVERFFEYYSSSDNEIKMKELCEGGRITGHHMDHIVKVCLARYAAQFETNLEDYFAITSWRKYVSTYLHTTDPDTPIPVNHGCLYFRDVRQFMDWLRLKSFSFMDNTDHQTISEWGFDIDAYVLYDLVMDVSNSVSVDELENSQNAHFIQVEDRNFMFRHTWQDGLELPNSVIQTAVNPEFESFLEQSSLDAADQYDLHAFSFLF